MNRKLSIIMPFAGEFPQVMFTIQAVAQQCLGKIDFEIIAVDNYCDELKKQGLTENQSGPAIAATVRGNSWLKYVEYSDALSHWQAKCYGVSKSTGDTLMFLDAHVIPSTNCIPSMFEMYHCPVETENGYENFSYSEAGTMHTQLTYKILEYHKLIYKLLVEHDCFYDYRFTGASLIHDLPYEVPCMSTCGMMISRKIYDTIGGWPKSLTCYGGGENFMNFTLAVTGYRKWVYNDGTTFHHGANRDYHYNYDGLVYNRLIAHYMFGGDSLLSRVMGITKGSPDAIQKLGHQAKIAGQKQRALIKGIQKMSIEEWREKWQST